jgi:purine-nucleoside phosphorylase
MTTPAASSDLCSRLDASVNVLRERAPRGFVPRVGVVLGSGLGAFGDTLDGLVKIPYGDLGFPQSGVVGHAGNLCLGTVGATRVPVACMQGRVHGYEGHSPDRVVFAVRALARWGCESFVLTNAAGAVNTALEPGDLMLMIDHLNLMGWTPLTGANDDALGPRFPDMSVAYDVELRALAHDAARDQGFALREGVYGALPGPSYETPAEIRMLRVWGADAVGMSTVPEVLALRHLGRRVLAVSCITNKGAGITKQLLDHKEVQEVADRTRSRFIGLLERTIAKM